ncbi:MAG: histidine kinase dimerization/phosphoacceptor domain -containing protein [Solirubrobacterales bacterium]
MSDDPKDLSEAKHRVDVQHDQGGPFVQAVDATSMAMIVTESRLPDNPIIFANSAFLNLSGYTFEEIIGRNYRFLYGADTDPEAAAKVDRALRTTGDALLELMLYRKDGRGIWVMQHVSTQHDDGNVARHFASFWDIDSRVRAEQEVRRAHDLLEQRVARRTRDLTRTIEELRRENDRRRAAEEVLLHTLDDKELLLTQRELLVKEVNHRVKNTLQMVSSLLTVQAGTTREPAVAEGLNAAVRRLNRLAEIHQLLYQSTEFGVSVALDAYLAYLCENLMLAAEVAADRVRMTVEVEEGRWSPDEAIPIALIVNEAVTNALKHAFPENRHGTVTVSLRQVGQNFYELTIADNGVGGGKLERPGSLGMKLIHTFARQLRGTVQTGADGGTRITVRFLHTELEPPRLAE